MSYLSFYHTIYPVQTLLPFKLLFHFRINLRWKSNFDQTLRDLSKSTTGAEGFEPANGGTKNRCLTTWRRPIYVPLNIIISFLFFFVNVI